MPDKIDLRSPSLDALAAALAYHRIGWDPHVMPKGQKFPKGKWKQPNNWTEERIKECFQASSNVGIALGKRSNNLIDIDLDCSEAVQIADHVLANLPSFGRKSNPRSHRLAYAELEKGRYTFDIPNAHADLFDGERNMLLEIRGPDHQTMFPPSTHPSGEKVGWHDDPADIPNMEAGELARRCGLIAFLSIVLNRYPADAGNRDEICMALTGTLLRLDYSIQQTDELVALIARLAGDDEHEKRGTKAEATSQRLKEKQPAWGLKELLKKLGIEPLETTIRKWLGQSQSRASRHGSNLPTIILENGKLPDIIDEAEVALRQSDVRIFQRYDKLVRPVRFKGEDSADGITREEGSLILRDVDTYYLTEKFALSANFEKRVQSQKDESEYINVRCDPPIKLANFYMARAGEWNLRPLNGLLNQPSLRADGTVLQKPGYDDSTGILLDFGSVQFPPIPESPTKEDAERALEKLRQPFREFCFIAEIDEAVVMAAILTGLVRHIFPSAPLFVFRAPEAGTGKTLLATTIGIIANGATPAVMTQGKNREEDEKRLASALYAGDRVILLDNCDEPIQGDFICTITTAPSANIRILGSTKLVTVITKCLIMATGNNVRLIGDIIRRTVHCHLDAETERPDQVEHSFDPVTEAWANRPELVVAGLTILRAYMMSERPVELKAMGSFDAWTLIRDALCWLGWPDVAETREQYMVDDPVKEELSELLSLWENVLGSKAVTLAEIANKAQQNERAPINELVELLKSCTGRQDYNTKSIGKTLYKHLDRIVDGKVLRSKSASNNSKLYWVEQIGKAADEEEIPF